MTSISDLKPGDIFVNYQRTRFNIIMPSFSNSSNNTMAREFKFSPRCAVVIMLEKKCMPDPVYGDVKTVYNLTYFMDGRIIKKFYEKDVLLTKCLFQLI